MRDLRLPGPGQGWRGAGKAALLAGVAALALAGRAQAKPPNLFSAPSSAAKSKPAPPPLPDDGLGPRDMLISADTLIDDRDHNTVTAEGHVQARYQGRTLRADQLIYDRTTGAVHAHGHAVILNPDGTSEYGQDIQVDEQFRAGVALGFSARLQQNVTLAAGAAIRRTETITELNNAIYTPCNVCEPDGTPKQPTFSVQADRMIEDRDRGVIYYRNAVIRIFGVPVFYSPVLWHPDPSTPRRSGLLAPRVEYGRRRGLSYEQPYLWVLSPSADLTTSVQLNTRVNPLLDLHYRERFYSGALDIRAGYTYESLFDSHRFFGNETSRSYILGRGQFQLDPNWNVGFGVERVTDQTFFNRYTIRDVYVDRGPYPTDTDRLISQAFAVREDRQSFVSIAAMSFQSLRAYGLDANNFPIYENDKVFPIVAPLIEGRYDPNLDIFGGRLRLTANAVALTRDVRVISVTDPTGVIPPGVQAFNGASTVNYLRSLPTASSISAVTFSSTRRASLEGEWRDPLTFSNGLQVEPFLQARGDAYSILDSQVLNVSTGTFSPGPSDVLRGFGTVGANLSMPFIRQTRGLDIILEPLAQLAISPTVKPNPKIPNEDSVSFEYDETNLFSINRFPGFDLYESGQRLNLGGRATVNWGGDRSASVLIGRTFRAEPDPVFTPQSGLAGTASDYVTAVSISPVPGLSFFNRARLDANTLNVRRDEAGLSYAVSRVNLGVHYVYDESAVNVTPAGAVIIGRIRNLDVSGSVLVTQHWGVTVNGTRDLHNRIFPLAQVGVFYQDECLRLDVLYTHDETYNRVIGGSDSVVLRLTLATLGSTSSVPSPNRYGSR